MTQPAVFQCTAFEGFRCIASGALADVAVKAKEAVDRGPIAPILIFDDSTGRLVELDLRGSADDVLRRYEEVCSKEAGPTGLAEEEKPSPRGPGRPRLGVVAREVTLLPRHWDWLSSQPGGASVALRKLVEQARRANSGRDRMRLSQEAANRFMTSLAGDLPGFEEATRALFAANRTNFDELVEPWPADVRNYARKLATAALEPVAERPADGVFLAANS